MEKQQSLSSLPGPFDAQGALEIGAVNQGCPHNQLLPKAKKMAQ